MEKSLAKMDEGVKDLKQAIDKNTDLTEKTFIQATKTNGRATALEEWSNQAKKIIEKNAEDIGTLKNYRWWFIGFAFAIGITGWFALEYIVNKSVETALLDNVTSINYEQ